MLSAPLIEDGRRAVPGKYWAGLCLLAACAGLALACMGGTLGTPHGQAGEPRAVAFLALATGSSSTLWTRHFKIKLVVFAGRLVLTGAFLWSTCKLGAAGFIGVAKRFEFPLPALAGVTAFLCVSQGPAMVIAAPVVRGPLSSIASGVLLVIFLLIATYVGHYKPMLAAEGQEKSRQVQQLMKNVAIMGGLIMMVGYDFLKISPTSGPVGRHVALWEAASPWVVELGRLVLVLIFVGAAAQLKATGLIGIAKHFGLPAPVFMGAAALLFLITGSLAVVAAPLVHSAVASMVGGAMLIVFLIIAMYVGHYKPMRAAESQEEKGREQEALVKNVSIIGALVMMIGQDLKQL